MKISTSLVVAMLWLTMCVYADDRTFEMAVPSPAYAADGRLMPPLEYREWTFLTSSLDMDYRMKAMPGMEHEFDNVFVQPSAYRKFRETGTWPDHTIIVKELRKAGGKSSINQRGHFQTPEMTGLEIHVKDSSRFIGGWSFFVTDGKTPVQRIPEQADCYACHREHGAVDNTFVQFYPTLIEIAEQRGTLSEAYRKDQKAN